MSLSYRRASHLGDFWRAGGLIADLDHFYPDIEDWYLNKVIPGALTGGDPFWLVEDGTRLVGLAIGRNRTAPKIACVRVISALRGRGVALHLMDRLLRDLNCDTPQITVAEELIHEWSRPLVERYHFSLDRVHRHLYRRGKLEYEFNALAPLATLSPY